MQTLAAVHAITQLPPPNAFSKIMRVLEFVAGIITIIKLLGLIRLERKLQVEAHYPAMHRARLVTFATFAFTLLVTLITNGSRFGTGLTWQWWLGALGVLFVLYTANYLDRYFRIPS